MHFIVLGAGNVGFQLAKQLIHEDRNVVLIEKDVEKAKQVAGLLDCLVINEVGNRLQTLRQAGIDKADYFIAVTDSDEINMIACGMASASGESGRLSKIARIRNLDYFETEGALEPSLGIDLVVNLEVEASKSIIRAIEQGAVSDIAYFEKSNLQMRSIVVSGTSVFRNRSIESIKTSVAGHFLVAVILRGNDYLIPKGNTLVRDGDQLYLIATQEDLEAIFAQAGREKRLLNKIVIIGGSGVGCHVADHFLRTARPKRSFFDRILRALSRDNRRKVNIIENDYDRCKYLSERYPNALVINADISDEGFADEEQLSDADVVIAVTENQELNIVNAVYAKSLGAKRAIVLVNKSSYLRVASLLGIEVTISPIDSMVSTILNYIRRSHTHSIYSISGGKVEIIELSVTEKSRGNGKKLSEIKLPEDTLILSVNRGSHDIVPDGTMSLLEGDNLLVITRKTAVPAIEKLFSG
jgi:trk system potassium uptake protein TrkA